MLSDLDLRFPVRFTFISASARPAALLTYRKFLVCFNKHLYFLYLLAKDRADKNIDVCL